MDSTHREFFEDVKALLCAADGEFASRLQDFRRHAELHFGEEDRQMRGGYPAAQCHIDEHRAVLASVLEVQTLVEAGDLATGRRLAAELARWFPMHTLEMDRGLAVWLQKQRLGGARVAFAPIKSRVLVVGRRDSCLEKR